MSARIGFRVERTRAADDLAEAGVVNREGRDAHSAFDGILDESTPEIRQLAVAVRDLIYGVYPQTVEVVWPRQGSVGWGIGPKKYSEQFCYFMAFKKHVTLGFYYGGELSDPAGLLGSGGPSVKGKLSMRSVRIDSAGDLERSELRALVQEAVRHIRSSVA